MKTIIAILLCFTLCGCGVTLFSYETDSWVYKVQLLVDDRDIAPYKKMLMEEFIIPYEKE